MKKALALLTALGMVLALPGCSYLEDEETGTNTVQVSGISYYISEVGSVEIVALTLDGSSLVVRYKWKNSYDRATSFNLSVKTEAFQDGIKCDSDYHSTPSGQVSPSDDVQTGTTVEVEKAYRLRNTTSQVDLEISGLWDILDKHTDTVKITLTPELKARKG